MESSIEVKEFNEFSNLVKIIGSFDFETSSLFGPKIKEAAKGKKLVILDGSKMEFMASAGLGILISVQKNMEKREGQIWLVNIQPQVMKVFKLTRLDHFFRFFISMQEVEDNLGMNEE